MIITSTVQGISSFSIIPTLCIPSSNILVILSLSLMHQMAPAHVFSFPHVFQCIHALVSEDDHNEAGFPQ